MALKLKFAISEAFSVDVTSDYFQYRTIKETAVYFETDKNLRKNAKIQQTENTIERLSFAQERVLVINQMDNSANCYNVRLYYKFTEEINIELFKKALLSVMRRQDILRTILVKKEGITFQKVIDMDRVEEQLEINKVVVEDEKHMSEKIILANNHVFDLYTELPIRMHFYYCGEFLTHASIIIHEIFFDYWSVGLFERELINYYRALKCNEPYNPASLVTYKDFTAWERRELNEENLSKLMTFWLNKMNDLEPINLPLDFDRPPQFNYQAGEEMRFEMDEDATISLKEIAKELKVSLYRYVKYMCSVLHSKVENFIMFHHLHGQLRFLLFNQMPIDPILEM